MAKSYLDKDGLLYFLQKIRPDATPSMDGTASTGTTKRFALQDHVHPTDTTRAPLASPNFSGTPTAPTASTGTNTTQIATTAFVANAIGAVSSGVTDVKINNASIVSQGVATIPAATTSVNGYMTTDQVTKLNGIAEGASKRFYGECGTAAGTATKTVSISNFTANDLVAGVSVTVKFTNSNTNTTGNVTLNVSSTGAKPIKRNGTVAIGNTIETSWMAGGMVTLTYDGTNWILNDWIFYGDRTAASGGTDLSLVKTGDKYTWNNKIDSTAKGSANGVCPLNASSKIDSTYLPSYVDDVVEAYARSGATALSSGWLSETSGGSALTPEAGKIYVLMADSGDYSANSQFRWGGTAYVKMNDGGVSAITNSEIDTIVAS